ncbi:nucleotide sugar dehydrogenase [Verrucomicrobium sp. BvORR034]|jgi:GDP-mannose 6-dehydrogenase|uniref:nucleotide sugar dehydrogenase n=1 Tax=Verrucomicrobium sp. BvORR034 TaxID=1396418 RepID=UPI000679C887|nr:nucleotide sugar dehydrogenase [Verrucomicrobium sp. BvORR034]
MQVSIFGLGYVGAVTAACLADKGHGVIGADVQQAKVDAFNAGESPIVEPGLDALMQAARQSGRLRATTDVTEAVSESEVSIVCVGTPSLESGRLNLDFVRKVSQQLVDAVKEKDAAHTIIFRSTMLPGSTRTMVHDFFQPLLDAGLVTIYYCPEFLREGTAVRDFREPSLCVVGTHDGAPPTGTEPFELLGENAEILAWEGAETIKYACNYFHALKVGFANEIGRVSKHLGVDGSRIMDVVCRDEKLNISRYYMKPGNPFGGSCLPKDVSALSSFARMEGVSLPVLDSVLSSNQSHLDALLKLITSKGSRKVGILGLAFKSDTDDLRGSPMVAVAETLLGRGYQLSVYDPQLNLSRLMGANEAEMQRRMPHLAQLLQATAAEVVAQSEVVIAAQKCAPLEELATAATADHWVIDVNGWRELDTLSWKYEGSCW